MNRRQANPPFITHTLTHTLWKPASFMHVHIQINDDAKYKYYGKLLSVTAFTRCLVSCVTSFREATGKKCTVSLNGFNRDKHIIVFFWGFFCPGLETSAKKPDIYFYCKENQYISHYLIQEGSHNYGRGKKNPKNPLLYPSQCRDRSEVWAKKTFKLVWDTSLSFINALIQWKM